MVKYPRDLESIAALQFCGLNYRVAKDINDRWHAARACNMVNLDFIDWVIEYLDVRRHHIDNCGGLCDQWKIQLQDIGVNDQLAAAIAMPGHDMVRLTQPALEWVIETMKCRYHFLEYHKSFSNERGHKGRQDPGRIHKTSGNTSDSVSVNTSDDILGTSNDPSTDTADNAYTNTYTLVPPANNFALPGCTVLWRAFDRMHVENCWRRPFRQGGFRLQWLTSQPGGDFNMDHTAWCFTVSLEGAQRHAAYLQNFASPAGVCLVRLALPDRLIEDAKPHILHFPAEDFKKAVYSCRTMDSKMLPRFLWEAGLVIGDACRSDIRPFRNMDDWSEISEHNLVKLSDGTTMTQHVLSCRGLLGRSLEPDHVTIHSALKPDEYLSPIIEYYMFL